MGKLLDGIVQHLNVRTPRFPQSLGSKRFPVVVAGQQRMSSSPLSVSLYGSGMFVAPGALCGGYNTSHLIICKRGNL